MGKYFSETGELFPPVTWQRAHLHGALGLVLREPRPRLPDPHRRLLLPGPHHRQDGGRLHIRQQHELLNPRQRHCEMHALLI